MSTRGQGPQPAAQEAGLSTLRRPSEAFDLADRCPPLDPSLSPYRATTSASAIDGSRGGPRRAQPRPEEVVGNRTLITVAD